MKKVMEVLDTTKARGTEKEEGEGGAERGGVRTRRVGGESKT